MSSVRMSGVSVDLMLVHRLQRWPTTEHRFITQCSLGFFHSTILGHSLYLVNGHIVIEIRSLPLADATIRLLSIKALYPPF